MALQEDLFPIGRLSKAANVSVDTIRYYDEIGLLKPAYISGESGYRYYSIAQVELLTRIIELKKFGFSLNEIKEMSICNDESPIALYQNRYWLLLQEKEKLQIIIDKLSKKIRNQQEVHFVGKKILLVDDAPFMRLMCTDQLKKKGYEVIGEAEDGMQGVEKYKSLQPDLVILDIAMPEHDGMWALKKIKTYDTNAKIIMLSAVGHLQAVVDSLVSGAIGFVVKPFQADSLLSAVHDVFQNEYPSINQIFLNHISHRADLSGERILSQDVINKILHDAKNAKQPNVLPSPALEEALKLAETDEYASSFVQDETTTLVRQLIQGQDKMISLLERLVEEKAQ